MDTVNNRPSVPVTPRLVLGVGLALFGAVLTLDRLGLVEADLLLRFWPVILIAIGVLQYRHAPGSQRGARSVNGVIWIVIGVWLLLNSLRILRVGIWDLFWPLVLIAIGVSLVRQTLRRSDTPAGPIEERLSVFAVLSGGKRAIVGPFRGGEITAFMGGTQIDLRQAIIPPGEVARLEVFAVMSGCDLVVPSTWIVTTPAVVVLGGIEDKRLPALPEATAVARTPPPQLILSGFLMMGGITIKS
jgi:cell wall-active antibiotic response 4TMS protein YvqF